MVVDFMEKIVLAPDCCLLHVEAPVERDSGDFKKDKKKKKKKH